MKLLLMGKVMMDHRINKKFKKNVKKIIEKDKGIYDAIIKV